MIVQALNQSDVCLAWFVKCLDKRASGEAMLSINRYYMSQAEVVFSITNVPPGAGDNDAEHSSETVDDVSWRGLVFLTDGETLQKRK